MVPKDHSETSPSMSFQGADSASSSLDPSDGLEAGIRGSVDISPRFTSTTTSGTSSSLLRVPMWPTAEPEYSRDFTGDKGGEGGARKNGSGTETFDSTGSDNIDESTSANTMKNANITSNLASLSTGSRNMNRSNSAGHSPVGEERRAPRGRMERAYSDIFFQMAAPENVADVASNDTGDNHARHTIGSKTKYVLYDPANHKKKSRKHLNTICEEVCTKIGKKALSIVRCFFYGLYEILVLGPGVGTDSEEGTVPTLRVNY